MDAAFATLGSQQDQQQQQILSTQEVPAHIYQPLLNIALHGYDANDVQVWYETILDQVRRMRAGDAQPAQSFSLTAPESSIDPQYTDFLDTECAARRATLATIDSCISPSTKLTAVPSTELSTLGDDVVQPGSIYAVTAPQQDNLSQQAYNTPQSYQTYTTTPQHLDTTPEPSQSQQQHLLPAWSPAPSSAPEPEIYTASLSTGNLIAFASEAASGAPTYPWLPATPQHQDLSLGPGQQQHTPNTTYTRTHSRNPSNQSQLSHHSMPASIHLQQFSQHQELAQHPQQQHPYLPLLIPYASAAGSSSIKSAAVNPVTTTTSSSSSSTYGGASLYSSTAGTYFPIIHVSSSRRRRKGGNGNGVKKNVAVEKGRRQVSV